MGQLQPSCAEVTPKLPRFVRPTGTIGRVYIGFCEFLSEFPLRNLGFTSGDLWCALVSINKVISTLRHFGLHKLYKIAYLRIDENRSLVVVITYGFRRFYLAYDHHLILVYYGISPFLTCLRSFSSFYHKKGIFSVLPCARGSVLIAVS